MTQLRIGYVPEHYLTPLHLAQLHYGLNAVLVPFPSGTGEMITRLRNGDLDLAIGLTEAWIAGLGKTITGASKSGLKTEDERNDLEGYRLIGSWVQSPLCWAVSAGLNREDIQSVNDLKPESKVGVSRIGSGSYIMSAVLAQKLSLSRNDGTPAFLPVILNNLHGLRKGVNSGEADFFMWEHYTTSSSWLPNAEDRVKCIGEIETPWPSWMIVASSKPQSTVRPSVQGADIVKQTLEKLQNAVDYYNDKAHREEVTGMIIELGYSTEDAKAWMQKTSFVKKVDQIDPDTIHRTLIVLEEAGVLDKYACQELEKRYGNSNAD